MIGSVASVLVALAFVSLGVGSYVAPSALAENYGLPLSTPTEFAYLRALGTRDFVLGLLVAGFALRSEFRPALQTTISLCAIVAAGDLAAVATVRGAAPKASLAIHAGGIVGLLAVCGLLGAEL